MTVPETQVQTAVSGTGAPSHPEQVWLQILETNREGSETTPSAYRQGSARYIP